MADPLLSRFGVDPDARLGGGGEADVYALDAGRVLRLYKRPSLGLATRLRAFYEWLSGQDLPFATPTVLEVGESDGRTWTIDLRLQGTGMLAAMPSLTAAEKAVTIDSYVRATVALTALAPPPTSGFGDLLAEHPVVSSSWAEFLMARVEPAAARAADDLAAEGIDASAQVERLHDQLVTVPPVAVPSLVHGDWFPGNVMIGNDLTVSALIDFSSLTFAGDPMMDVAGAVIFADSAVWTQPDHVALARTSAEALGFDDLDRHLALYRRWYGLFFSQYKADDAELFSRCVEWLRPGT
ncbi:MAG TPA: aminoglycoside phosphotransferase family protein [Acidimicrobiales bacterium]|nr:aminoglycoside phosphotransferase family protein [Acidimicrobiales bacterium]